MNAVKDILKDKDLVTLEDILTAQKLLEQSSRNLKKKDPINLEIEESTPQIPINPKEPIESDSFINPSADDLTNISKLTIFMSFSFLILIIYKKNIRNN